MLCPDKETGKNSAVMKSETVGTVGTRRSIWWRILRFRWCWIYYKINWNKPSHGKSDFELVGFSSSLYGFILLVYYELLLVDNHYKTIECLKYVGCICSTLLKNKTS